MWTILVVPMVAEENDMIWMIKADTYEELYQEAAKAMLRGYRFATKAGQGKSGRWVVEMVKV